jgi:23S rRNA pseudouridine2605 synthase
MKKSTNSHFAKFGNKKSNAAIKEQFKQDKRKVKKEREEYFEQKKAAARKAAAPLDSQAQIKGAKLPPTHTRKISNDLMPLK